jgi:hypothetical protein
MLTSCQQRVKPEYDYSFTLPDGTWVCDHFNPSCYVRCEHVLSGRKAEQICLGEDVTVLFVNENTI